MGFCTAEQHEEFLREVPLFERMLVSSGVKLVKFWLDISPDEQAKRLKARRTDPLKVFKTSPLDDVAEAKWDDYTAARDEMLRRTDSDEGPWICVRADHKKPARLNILRAALAPSTPRPRKPAAARPVNLAKRRPTATWR
eukprot:gene805-biopygen684